MHNIKSLIHAFKNNQKMLKTYKQRNTVCKLYHNVICRVRANFLLKVNGAKLYLYFSLQMYFQG